MTMEELNAIYNNMSVYGDTYNTPPITTIPTDPNAGQPPILEPLIPIVKQLGKPYDNNNGGIKALAGMDYGYDSVFDNTNITPIMPNGEEQPQTNFEYDIGEGTIPQADIDNNKTNGIAGLFKLLQKISPMANIMKLGKTGIETAQKYFADKKEDQRLFEIQEAEKAKQLKIAQEQIRIAEEQKAMQQVIEQQAMDEQKYKQQAPQYQRPDQRDQAQNRQQEREQAGPGYSGSGTAAEMGSFARGGRIRYGNGGIVTL